MSVHIVERFTVAVDAETSSEQDDVIAALVESDVEHEDCHSVVDGDITIISITGIESESDANKLNAELIKAISND